MPSEKFTGQSNQEDLRKTRKGIEISPPSESDELDDSLPETDTQSELNMQRAIDHDYSSAYARKS